MTKSGWSGWVRAHPHLFDAGLAVLIFLITVGGLTAAHRMGEDPTTARVDLDCRRRQLAQPSHSGADIPGRCWP